MRNEKKRKELHLNRVVWLEITLHRIKRVICGTVSREITMGADNL